MYLGAWQQTSDKIEELYRLGCLVSEDIKMKLPDDQERACALDASPFRDARPGQKERERESGSGRSVFGRDNRVVVQADQVGRRDVWT